MLERVRRALRAGTADSAEPSMLVQGNRVTLLHDGARAFPSMLAAIRSATREVLLEMYWFGSDRTGRAFADALMERARAGVVVRVIFDAVGCIGTDRRMFSEMEAAGCVVHEHHPVAPWRARFRWAVLNNRDHRKILVVDGRVAFTGGVNLGDPWAAESEGGGGWRDDMVRVEGPAAIDFRGVFLRTWRRMVRDAHAESRGIAARMSARPPAPSEDDPNELQSDGVGVSVLTTSFRRRRSAIRRFYLEKIRAARRYVYITNSYFAPDWTVRHALASAVRRGVDVRVIVPKVSDVPAVDYAGRRLFDWLLSRGVILYQWDRSVLHAKTAVIDDAWCTIGTYNLDYRSWRLNLEVNAAIEDAGVARAMRK